MTIQQIRKEKTKLCLLFMYLFLNEIIDISTKEDTNWGVPTSKGHCGVGYNVPL